MTTFPHPPMATTVRQCKVCHKIVSWPIVDMADALALNYQHCGVPTEFIEIRPSQRESVSCEGGSE